MTPNIFTSLLLLPLIAIRPQTSGYQVGDKVQDFSLAGIDGKTYALKSFTEAKGFIVVFTCNTCPYAQDNEGRVIALHTKYEPKGYPVIAINSNDPGRSPGDALPEMKARAQSKGYAHVYLFDESQAVARQFGASRTPQIYVLQRNESDLEVRYIGAIDDSPRDASLVTVRYVENAVDALMAGKDPDPNFVKAIGCTIKWRL